MNVNSRKRKHAVTGKDDLRVVSKRICLDINNEDVEFPSDVQHESKQDLSDELYNAYQTHQFPHRLIELMYQLDMSVLYSLRKYVHEHKYPSFLLAFESFETGKFNNIVLYYERKSIHIQVENVDKCYMNNDISYDRLFTKEKQTFSIKNYFNSFVKHLISKSASSSNNIEYLIVFTNAGLDLTKDKALKRGRSRNFYPFKFDSINIEECDILKDFLFTNNDVKGCDFYQFSKDNTSREELLKRLEFSSAVQKVLKERKSSQEREREIKEEFLDKLILAVNQPNREELNSIIKKEIEKYCKVQCDYTTLRKEILSDLTAPEKFEGKLVSGIIYELNLLISFLYDMFLSKHIFSINSESYGISNDITIKYKARITYIKTYNADSNIGYSQLFPSRQQEKKNTFSINKLFTIFAHGLKNNVRYFIVYTNVGLDLTEEKILKKRQSRDFYPLKFDNIDIQKKRYKILRHCLCINKNGLYQFSKEETTRKELLHLLKYPSVSQKVKERRFHGNEEKEQFLDKLIFAINQPDKGELASFIKNEIDKSKVPYNYEELNEIALRWLESHEFGPITKEIMQRLLKDIKSNRSSYQKIQNKSFEEEIKFARSVVGEEGTPAFSQFLDFIIKGDGATRLDILRRNKINLANVSSILNRSKASAAKAFKELCDLWFDEHGNKSHYLETLEEEEISLASISGILNGARANASKAFKEIYDLWFDEKGNKTQYLKILKKEGLNLTNISSILSGAGANAPKAFKELYDLWFDEQGKRTEYFEILKTNGMHLTSISSILSGAGSNAPKTFKELYGLWFDEQGNKTPYLKSLDKRINLSNMTSILGGAGANAPKAFKNLYDLWFDAEGNTTQYLKTFEKEGIHLDNVSSILSRARTSAPKAFKDLYDLWFDGEGNKTLYMKTLEKEGVNLTSISSILSGARTNAANVFKELYNLWFDGEGNKTSYLITLKKGGIHLSNVSNILHGARANAPEAFKDLYELWFDREGNKTQRLKILEKERINIADVSGILGGAGANASKAFKELYDIWFDEKGNKTQFLKTLEENGIYLTNMSSILGGAGSNSAKAFKELYDLWFDKKGIRKPHLEHFIKGGNDEESFSPHNLSGILSRAGASAKDAFEKLHSICFDNKGKRTELLDDFYKAGFKSRNLSSIACGAGVRASAVLKQLHSVCFDNDNKGKITELLKDFYKAGFRPGDLCSILSGSAGSLVKFHAFCFIKKTKKYLYHFLNEKDGFTATNLSETLHGAKANICSALTDFHDVCFNGKGKRTKLLVAFHKVGFTPSDLSNILSMAGSNAASILKKFHKLCFNKENYLNHFLAKRKLFKPKDLSNLLHRVGINVCSAFEKLHNLCFDKEGNKTNYLKNLIKNNRHEMFNILYEKARKGSIFLDKVSM